MQRIWKAFIRLLPKNRLQKSCPLLQVLMHTLMWVVSIGQLMSMFLQMETKASRMLMFLHQIKGGLLLLAKVLWILAPQDIGRRPGTGTDTRFVALRLKILLICAHQETLLRDRSPNVDFLSCEMAKNTQTEWGIVEAWLYHRHHDHLAS